MRNLRVESILIVEDEPAVQELLAFNMKQSAYRAIQAYGISEALAYINQTLTPPNLILLDWILPDGYGIDLVHALRNDERMYRIPIILLTARVGEHNKALGLKSGADDYITKPFSPRELMVRIRAMLDSRTPHKSDGMGAPHEMGLPPPIHPACTAKPDPDLGHSDALWL